MLFPGLLCVPVQECCLAFTISVAVGRSLSRVCRGDPPLGYSEGVEEEKKGLVCRDSLLLLYWHRGTSSAFMLST